MLRDRYGKELGEPELGFLLVCSSDFPFVEGFGADMRLARTQTIMQGATHCDFRYRRQQDRYSPLGHSRLGRADSRAGNVGFPPIAIEFCVAAKFRDVP